MVVIVKESNSALNNDGVSFSEEFLPYPRLTLLTRPFSVPWNSAGSDKKRHRSRYAKGLSKLREKELGIRSTYHGKSLLQSTAVKRFQPSFPHTHTKLVVENEICTICEARMVWGQRVLLYKVTNACPSNRTRAVLDVNARVRTSLHRQPSNVSNHLWTSFRGFLRHSASSVFPLRGISSTDPNQHSQKEQAVAQSQPELGRNGLYMRMTLAERDSLLKHHAAKMPFYTYHLLGAYQDPHQNTVIVLSDMRDSSVDRSLTTFQHDEALIISTVIVPLLQHLVVLHGSCIAHHHISPAHVFIPSAHARGLTCTLPCPAGHPDDINKMLPTPVPDECFAPETWSVVDGERSRGSTSTCLKCDTWSVGILCVLLFLGKTVFESSDYRTLVSQALESNPSRQIFVEPRTASQRCAKQSYVSLAVQAVSAAIPRLGPFIATLSGRVLDAMSPSTSSAATQDGSISGWEVGLLEPQLKNDVQILVDEQLDLLLHCGASENFVVLVRGLLQPDPDSRLSAPDALLNPVFRSFIRSDTAASSTLLPKATQNTDSNSKAPGFQLWDIVRQSRPQLAEMARRDTLVGTLADRRDGLERLADLVQAKLAGEYAQGHNVIAHSPVGSGEQESLAGSEKAASHDTDTGTITPKQRQKCSSKHSQSPGKQRPTQGQASLMDTRSPNGTQPTCMKRRSPEDLETHVSLIGAGANLSNQHAHGTGESSVPIRKLSGRVRFSGCG